MDDQRTPADTLAQALADAARQLTAAGVENGAADARVLARKALGLAPEALVRDRDRPLTRAERAALDALVARRAAREPVSRIAGRREFWSLDFVLTPACLDPRPDSETLVEAVLAALDARGGRARPWRVLDLGTGSGCLLLALLAELPHATGTGVDASADALAVAGENARRLGLAARTTFVQGDWTDGLAGRFDAIVANPPYIETGALSGLAPEVRDWDPRTALDGGADGLDAYRAILPGLARVMAPGAVAALEIGWDQAARVAALGQGAGLTPAGTARDLAGNERCLLFQGPVDAI